MWTEAKTGIFLGLLSLAGAGVIKVFPQHTAIGWGLIGISIIGFILLALHHYGLELRSTSTLFGTLLLGIVFIGFPAGFIIYSFIESIEQMAITPKSASECRPQDSLDITPSHLIDLYNNRTKLQGDELAAGYIGKCMSITGKVRDILPNDFFPGSFLVVIADNAGKWVTAKFTAESSENVPHIPRNATITVYGEIQSVSNSGLTLQECKLDKISQN